MQSINLTITPGASDSEHQKPAEYSARDVKPAKLLLVDLQRAHSIFLLHHAPSMNNLYASTKRPKFLSIVSRYWDLFVLRWNVLMHGNPTNNLYRGIKIAGCGELGIGVGEENRGSGEREILEGFVHRVEGIVDVIVSKFGDHRERETPMKGASIEVNPKRLWIGSGNDPDAEDGAIFLGSGTLSKKSLRDLANWVEDLYRWGAYAYGVFDDSKASRRSRRSKKYYNLSTNQIPSKNTENDLGIVVAKSRAVDDERIRQKMTCPPAERDLEVLNSKKNRNGQSPPRRISNIQSSLEDDSNQRVQFSDYLKLGYGRYWTLSGTWSINEIEINTSKDTNTHNHYRSNSDKFQETSKTVLDQSSYCSGRFMIGLDDCLENNNNSGSGLITSNSSTEGDFKPYKPKISLSKVILELDCKKGNHLDEREQSLQRKPVPLSHHSNTSSTTKDSSGIDSFQVVVYTAQPFIFVFILKSDTNALESPHLYHSLHHQLQSILKPLRISTKYRALKPEVKGTGLSEATVYDLIWDPKNLTLNSTIPNVPDLCEPPLACSVDFSWTESEAINTHMQIIKTLITCTEDSSEIERICKTSRGWWILWARLIQPVYEHSQKISSENFIKQKFYANNEVEIDDIDRVKSMHKPNTFSLDSNSDLSLLSFESTRQGPISPTEKEIILIRKEYDCDASKSINRFSGTSSALGSDKDVNYEPSNLAQGIGFDTRQYIQGLLNLNS